MKYLHTDNRYKIIGLNMVYKAIFIFITKIKNFEIGVEQLTKCRNILLHPLHQNQTATGVFNNLVYQEISLTTHLTRSLTECLRVIENFTARGHPYERWVSTPSWLGLLLASPSTIMACLPTSAFGPRLLYVH